MLSKICFEYGVDQLDAVAQKCVKMFEAARVVTFTGTIGAGKTTLIAAIAREYGVVQAVSSPTYTYMQVYTLADGRRLYHFDLYRLKSLQEFVQAGFDEYLYQPDSICFIEWPEIIESLLQEDTRCVNIDFVGLEKRRLVCSYNVNK